MNKQTTVLYKFNTPEYKELEFIKWTPQCLVVKFPASGKPWRMNSRTVNHWLKIGVLKFDGWKPEWVQS
jgi:hypothetical protein